MLQGKKAFPPALNSKGQRYECAKTKMTWYPQVDIGTNK